MRIAVAGATGQVGTMVLAELERRGHDAVRISRSDGVDVLDSEAVAAVLDGADAVIDVLSTNELDRDRTHEFFTSTTESLLSAEQRAGVGHHVVLSIVGIEKVPDNGHYVGKVAQERAVTSGGVPWSIVRATQFFEFAATVASWTIDDGVATLAPLLVQPVAIDDVAQVLVETAVGAPTRSTLELAGPNTEDLVDLCRRTFAARGDDTDLRASWRDGPFGLSMSGEVLLPGPDARLGTVSAEEWLEGQHSA